MNRKSLVYFKNLEGHRSSYLQLFEEMFKLHSIIGKFNLKIVVKMLLARKLLFGTLDDSYFLFIVVSIIRNIFRKPTVGLFLRPAQCFKNDKLIYKAKYKIFRLINKINLIRIVTIVPFAIKPEYSKIAREGIQDPHLWDMYKCLHNNRNLELENGILEKSEGKKIISFIGSVNDIKGIKLLCEMIAARPSLVHNFEFVVAGKFDVNAKSYINTLLEHDVNVIDRYIDESELSSLYFISQYIWCCYRPDYDQASGIFGRAIQYNRIPIIRKGALIEKYIDLYKLEAISLPYDNPSAAAAIIENFTLQGDTDLNSYGNIFEIWEKDFKEIITKHLSQ